MAGNNEIQPDIERPESITPSSLHPRLQTRERDTKKQSWRHPLYLALRRGKWDEIKKILDKDKEAIHGPVRYEHDTPLEFAIEHDLDIQIIENLVQRTPHEILAHDFEEHRHYPNCKSAIFWAIFNRNFAAARLIVSKNPATLYKSCDRFGVRPMKVALYHGKIEMVHYLLRLASLYVVNTEDHQTDADAANREASFYVLDEEDQQIQRINREILADVLNIGMYDVASALIELFPTLRRESHEELWTRLVDRCDNLPCRSRLSMWQSVIYSWTTVDSMTISMRSILEFEMENVHYSSTATSYMNQVLEHLVSRGYTQLQKQAWRLVDMLGIGETITF